MENSARNIELDVLRGITVAGMILVNNPGGTRVFAPLKHADWFGCTPTDLVFPFFLLCAGMAMAFSFAAFGNTLCRGSISKLLKRGALLFLVGLLLNMIPTHWNGFQDWVEHIRIMGILQRIALCSILGGILALWLRTPAKLAFGIAGVTLLHWLILRCCGTFPGWDTPEGNAGTRLDLALFGADHLYQGYHIPFDPEGILGTLSACGTLLLGYLAGVMLKSGGSISKNLRCIGILALSCLAAGYIWDIFLPICKPLWTGSYVLCSGGWGLIALCIIIILVHLAGWKKWTAPFVALGRNPLLIFAGCSLFVKFFRAIIHWDVLRWGKIEPDTMTPLQWFYDHCCAGIFGDNEFASLFYALCLVVLFTALAVRLYKKNIIVKL